MGNPNEFLALKEFCILEPSPVAFARHSGPVIVRGWMRVGVDDESPAGIVVKLGKRSIRGGVDRVLADGGKVAVYHFDLRFSTGPGLKRLSIFSEAEDGNTTLLGTRLFRQTDRHVDEPTDSDAYGEWISGFESTLPLPGPQDHPASLGWVIWLEKGDGSGLGDTLVSVMKQQGALVTAMIVDAGGYFSGWTGRMRLKALAGDARVQVVAASKAKDGGPSRMPWQRIREWNVDWVGFLMAGDRLGEQAAMLYADAIGGAGADAALVYADEDALDAKGRRRAPAMKPGWNPDLLLSTPYIGRACMVSRKRGLERVDLESCSGSHWLWDLQLRVTDPTMQPGVCRVPRILLHKRFEEGKTEAVLGEDARSMLDACLKRRGIRAEVSVQDRLPACRTRYLPEGEAPMVSLIIPTRDCVDVLRVCVDSILAKTTYPNYEIIVLDNDSCREETLRYFEEIRAKGCRVERFPGKFNYSAINNFGVGKARGAIIGLLNSDLEVIEGDWLTEMVSQAQRPEIGAVGARLLYPDDRLQHAGVIVGVGHVAAHAWRLCADEPDVSRMRAHVVQNYSAVTAACLVVRKAIFEQVGGFNAVDLAITYNDVDICIRICEAGYRNLYTPFARLYHHESASRGPEDTPEKRERYEREVNYMRKKWSAWLKDDPAYHPLLTRFREDFALTNAEEQEIQRRGVPLF